MEILGKPAFRFFPAMVRARSGHLLGPRARWFIAGIGVGLAVLGLVGPVMMVGHRSAWPGEAWFGGAVLGAVAELSFDAQDKPVFDDEMLVLGKYTYTQQRCWFCHADAKEGQREAPNELHVFPPPRNFPRGDALGRSNEQLYWSIEQGVAFTSMPSFGSRMSAEEMWSVVAYIQALSDGVAESVPSITPTPAPARP